MNNPLLVLLLAAALPRLVLAQSKPAIDAGLAIGKRGAAVRAVKGVDELGSGVKAVIVQGRSYEPDTSAWVAGANYSLGASGNALATVRQWSIAYAYPFAQGSHGDPNAAAMKAVSQPERAAL